MALQTGIYTHPVMLTHDTRQHPEQIARLQSIQAVLSDSEIVKVVHASDLVVDDILLAIHTPEQIRLVKKLAAEGGGALDPDTYVSEGSYEAAIKAVALSCTAVDDVIGRRFRNGFCAVRPPGHHATEDLSMGFCLFNNVAAAASYAKSRYGVGRILIVDWDVHHGNGTQDIFYEDDGVYFFSMHRFPFYPGTGDTYETGRGKGLGFTKNLPVAFGTGRKVIVQNFCLALESICDRFKPELILLSAGFDAHYLDPIGSLGLETEDFLALSQAVVAAADTYAEGRLVSVLEGGYHLGALTACVEAHIGALSSL